MNWDGYTVFAVISGIVLLLFVMVPEPLLKMSLGSRALLGAGGVACISYAIYVANQTSGIYYFPVQIFVIPLLPPLYLFGGAAKRWWKKDSVRRRVGEISGVAAAARQATPPPAGAVYCGRCRAAVGAGQRSCLACGTEVPQPPPHVSVANSSDRRSAAPTDASPPPLPLPPPLPPPPSIGRVDNTSWPASAFHQAWPLGIAETTDASPARRAAGMTIDAAPRGGESASERTRRHCGTPAAGGDNFCSSCGQPLAGPALHTELVAIAPPQEPPPLETRATPRLVVGRFARETQSVPPKVSKDLRACPTDGCVEQHVQTSDRFCQQCGTATKPAARS